MKTAQPAPKNIDEYIADFPPTVRTVLRRVRSTIRKALPGAEEVISYRIPAFRVHGSTGAVFRRVEETLLVVSLHRSPGESLQGRTRTI